MTCTVEEQGKPTAYLQGYISGTQKSGAQAVAFVTSDADSLAQRAASSPADTADPLHLGGENGLIVLTFPRPTVRIELTGEQAFEFAKRLIRRARDVGGISILLPRKISTSGELNRNR
jgi:hypothetical protein